MVVIGILFLLLNLLTHHSNLGGTILVGTTIKSNTGLHRETKKKIQLKTLRVVNTRKESELSIKVQYFVIPCG